MFKQIYLRYKGKLSVRQYGRYLIIGAIVGIITVALREVIAAIMPSDTPTYYLISIISAYAVGIVLNFTLQHAFTFHGIEGRKLNMFGKFIIAALIGILSTSLLSVFFRYSLKFDSLFGTVGDTIAFVLATFTSSVLTYWMSARFVFQTQTSLSGE